MRAGDGAAAADQLLSSGGGSLLVAATFVLWVWLSLALMAVLHKAGRPRWRAWVPVVNLWTLFELGGMRGWWAVAIAAGAVVTFAATAFTAASAVPWLLWIVCAIPVVVLLARMFAAVDRGFGLGAAHTILGVLLPPVWASVVGWGSARWLRPTPIAVASASPVVPGFAVPPPLPPTPPPPAAFSAPRRPEIGGAAFTLPEASENVAALTVDRWAPPPPPQAPPTEPTPTPPSSPSPAWSAVAGPVDGVEPTVVADRRHRSWSLLLPDGSRVPVTADAVVLGRSPLAPAHAVDAQRVTIEDLSRTVSKTHALLRRTDTGWALTDLGSTNGSFTGPRPGPDTEVTGSSLIDGLFFLGDAPVRLQADS